MSLHCLSPAGWPASTSKAVWAGLHSTGRKTAASSVASTASYKALDRASRRSYRSSTSAARPHHDFQSPSHADIPPSWSRSAYTERRPTSALPRGRSLEAKLPTLQRKLRRNHRQRPQSLGVFTELSQDAENERLLQSVQERVSRRRDAEREPSEPLNTELKAIGKLSMEAVANLPPLTDEDFREIWQDLKQGDLAESDSADTLLLEGGEGVVPSVEAPVVSLHLLSPRAMREQQAMLQTTLERLQVSYERSGTGAENISASVSSSPQASTEEASVIPATSSQQAYLSILDLAEQAQSGSTVKGTLPTAIFSQDEISSLALAAAQRSDLRALQHVLQLAKTQRLSINDDTVAAILRIVAHDANSIQTICQSFKCAGFRIAAGVHRVVLDSLVRSQDVSTGLSQAEHYLRALETLQSPADASTYALVLSALFQRRRALEHARSRAWNLFTHARLVAHPVPSVDMYNAMMYGCGLDDVFAPERALDLFTEMVTEHRLIPTYETYLNLIRVCARSRDDVYYFESLRLLKEITARGLKPKNDIFNAILEGARRRGDLARAKEAMKSMIDLVRQHPGKTEYGPDESSITSLLLTYATYKPPVLNLRKIQQDQQQPPDSQTSAARVVPSNDKDTSSHIKASPFGVLDAGLPSSRAAAVREVRSILGIFGISSSTSSSLTDTEIDTDITSPRPTSLTPTTSIMNAYMNLLTTHSSLSDVLNIFKNTMPNLGVAYNEESWEIILSALDQPVQSRGKARQERAEEARDLFGRWEAWFRQRLREKSESERGLAYRHVELIWARCVSIEARAQNLDAGYALLQRFESAYPPSDIITHGQTRAVSKLPQPSYPLNVASPLYPETSPASTPAIHNYHSSSDGSYRLPSAPKAPLPKTSALNRALSPAGYPPMMHFAHVYALFARLREMEDERADEVVEMLVRYAEAAREAAKGRGNKRGGTVASRPLLE